MAQQLATTAAQTAVSSLDPKEIIRAAIEAKTLGEAVAVNEMIVKAVGQRYVRPLADRWNNQGLISFGGSFDHKALEPVTNMQDAVIELEALRKFGTRENIPYKTPTEAERDLLGHLSAEQKADLASVELFESDPPAKESKTVTIVYRDKGCGIAPLSIPETIFHLGSSHKHDAYFLQGAFGLGGAITFRNCSAVVLVTRRHPDLLQPGEKDMISVSVCEWTQSNKRRGLCYLVTSDWDENRNPIAAPWSVDADAYPDFEPGTHLALISFETHGFYRSRNDRKGFEFMLDTRLWNPIFPVRFFNKVVSGDHQKNKSGLRNQFAQNKRQDRKEGSMAMPFRANGSTYQIPVSYYYFEPGPSAQTGGMRNFVYGDHAVIFVSNGQAHHHWNPNSLKQKTTEIKKICDRLLVVVDTDELPIELRTTIFTPDRSDFVNKKVANDLEAAVAAFLDSWPDLYQFNDEMLRKAVEGLRDERPTIAIARKISRALKSRGFSISATKKKVRPKPPPPDLYPDPTHLEGPNEVTANPGQTKFIFFNLNAEDSFFSSGRGRLEVVCDHHRVSSTEISVGDLRGGTIRVSVLIPDDVSPCESKLTASIRNWHRSRGGIGDDHVWETKLVITDEDLTTSKNKNNDKKNQEKKSDKQKAGEGGLVGLLWKTVDEMKGHGWHHGVPGHVDEIPASTLATARPEYAELVSMGDKKIPTIFLNTEFSPLKKYLEARLRKSTPSTADSAKDRYALGTGLGLLMIHQEFEKRRRKHEVIEDEVELVAQQAAARSTIAMLPEYDSLEREFIGDED